MQRFTILWADDEIELLKPYIVFLENKGYDVTPVPSGADALDLVEKNNYDIIFLDEMMAGMTGLDTLVQIKKIKPSIPVVMITKSEEERIMEEAIGSKIADYLIKPINPNQILLSIKKLLDNKRLVSEKTNSSYMQDFRQLSMQYNDELDFNEWSEIYKKLVFWELEIDRSSDKSMEEVYQMQKAEANARFSDFIEDNYASWMTDPNVKKPVMSHNLLKTKVFPLVNSGSPLFFILIDNFRLDQWKIMEDIIGEFFTIESDETYFSILPTATSYARNSIFSGLTPLEMSKQHADIWVNDEGDNEDGLNKNEDEFLRRQLKKNNLQHKFSYHKILNNGQAKSLVDNFNNLMKDDLVVVVYNFIDMLSHARTDMAVIKELAPDEAAYRSITKSWIQHSPMLDFLKLIASKNGRLVITTDHGMVKVKNAKRIVGDRNVNTNLRYKQGRNLNLDDKRDFVIEVRKPETYKLPSPNLSTSYFFTTCDYFFAYPNNYNHYVSHYKDTFQHGGVSLEEVIIPFAVLKAK
ncbi:T9SS response regulator signal transducer PorX [Lacihabitans soyangensis]|jgi:CheY-like chemotaxis protein|uniref:PglZ domain-containing protein n=1 Tax=Lacihabitans soyangensis TaxID=869394 RepID=A0AAE3KUU5_9BACT|nr:PglZ domain-containing protein [Lacihabitans soyangensis]MCP9765368.1 PglZ domain-containing protein [Lacihabitans soyangensis]